MTYRVTLSDFQSQTRNRIYNAEAADPGEAVVVAMSLYRGDVGDENAEWLVSSHRHIIVTMAEETDREAPRETDPTGENNL